MAVDDVGRVIELPGVRYLQAADQVLEEMLSGWRRQQLARNLALATIESREKLVRRFLGFTNEMPWRPAVQHVDEFFGDLRAEHSLRQSTVREYQNALRLFCAYLIEPAYGWDRICEQHFGTHPTQVCFEPNTAAHTQDNEQDPRKRAFTRPELQAFFDRADAEVARTRSLGRKGWLPAMRDAVLFKTAYAWGCAATRLRTCRAWTSPATPTPEGSAATDCCTCATARRTPDQHPSDARC